MTLGLNMIVKNESEVLERALKSIVSAVDEVVIVDTGSTDNTVEIARRYTDKVLSFRWADDFSAARNFALENTKSDYVLWLDADDIVPKKTAAAIKAFMKTANGRVDMVMLPYILDDGKFMYNRERIIKNNAGLYWQGIVHEVIAPHGNVINLPHGIVHKKPEGRSSGTRNLDIYRNAIAGGKALSPREKYYYARELYYNGLYEKADAEFVSFLSGDGYYVNKIDACCMLARCRIGQGDRFGAKQAAALSFSFGPPTGEACCILGGLSFDENDYRTAAVWYRLATTLKPDMSTGAFVDGDSYGFTPLVWLSVCYDRLGDKKKAYRYHCRAKKLRPDHPSITANEAYFISLGFGSCS